MRDDFYSNEQALAEDAGETALDKFCKQVNLSQNTIAAHHNKLPEVYGPAIIADLPKIKCPETLRTAVQNLLNKDKPTATSTDLPVKGKTFVTEHNQQVNKEDAAYTKHKRKEAEPTKPAHYNDTSITALQVIDSWDANFNIGNAIKYIARYKKKGDPVTDLHKAIDYLRLEIDKLQK